MMLYKLRETFATVMLTQSMLLAFLQTHTLTAMPLTVTDTE